MKEKKGCIWNYHGSKLRYLDEILSVIPEHDKDYSVVDLFTGGSSVATNLPANWIVTANDLEKRVIDFSKHLQLLLKGCTPVGLEDLVASHCRMFVKDNKDEEGYQLLKDLYNEGFRTPFNLFALTMASNSNMMRFDKSGKQNIQFGKRYYNNNSRKKMLSYLERLQERDITFTSKDFRGFSPNEADIFIIDPPYRKSKATYTERGQWGLQEEVDLLTMCDNIHAEGNKFIYFNQTVTQDVKNTVVSDWCSKYNTVVLKDTTTGCSAQRKNVGETVEVMVHNF